MTGPAIRTVYAAGQTAIGEVEDHGVGNIRAFTLTSVGPVALGTFPDRRAAITAIENARANAGTAG
jgi:hypothetical protein